MTPGQPLTCQRCGRRPATVHFTAVSGNEKTDRYLCEECAREEGAYHLMLGPQFTVHNVLGGLIGQVPATLPPTAGTPCPHCGHTYQRFAETGRLGCDRCYETFRDPLEPLVRRIQGATQHRGKVPRRSGERLRQAQQLEDLRRQLQELVAKEAFEEAARVRDQIRQIEELAKGGSGDG